MHRGRDTRTECGYVGEGGAKRLNEGSCKDRQPEKKEETLDSPGVMEDCSDTDDKKEGVWWKGDHAEPEHCFGGAMAFGGW